MGLSVVPFLLRIEFSQFLLGSTAEFYLRFRTCAAFGQEFFYSYTITRFDFESRICVYIPFHYLELGFCFLRSSNSSPSRLSIRALRANISSLLDSASCLSIYLSYMDIRPESSSIVSVLTPRSIAAPVMEEFFLVPLLILLFSDSIEW